MIEETKQLGDGSVPESETKQEIVKNRDGSDRVVYREHGMFAKREKEDLSIEHIQAATVARLTDEGEDGKSPYQKAVDNVVKNAGLDAERPVLNKLGEPVYVDGKLLTEVDPKLVMASSKSLDSVAKLMGLPKKEIQQPQNKVEIVNLTLPKEVLDGILARQNNVIKEYELHIPTSPAWAEVVEVHTNEPTKE